VAVPMQAGAHGQDHRDDGHDRGELDKASTSKCDGSDDHEDEKRRTHVRTVLVRCIADDVPVRISLGNQGVAQRGMTEREVLVQRGDDQADWVARQTCDGRGGLFWPVYVLGSGERHPGVKPAAHRPSCLCVCSGRSMRRPGARSPTGGVSASW